MRTVVLLQPAVIVESRRARSRVVMRVREPTEAVLQAPVADDQNPDNHAQNYNQQKHGDQNHGQAAGADSAVARGRLDVNQRTRRLREQRVVAGLGFDAHRERVNVRCRVSVHERRFRRFESPRGFVVQGRTFAYQNFVRVVADDFRYVPFAPVDEVRAVGFRGHVDFVGGEEGRGVVGEVGGELGADQVRGDLYVVDCAVHYVEFVGEFRAVWFRDVEGFVLGAFVDFDLEHKTLVLEHDLIYCLTKTTAYL